MLEGIIMLDLSQTYEVVIFSVGDTKAGTKMGKLQLKNINDDTLLNCILWEEALNRIDSKIFRTGNLVKILGGSYNEKYNNCLISSLELVKEAKIGLSKEDRDKLFNSIVEYANEIEEEDLKKYVVSLLFEYEEAFKKSPPDSRGNLPPLPATGTRRPGKLYPRETRRSPGRRHPPGNGPSPRSPSGSPRSSVCPDLLPAASPRSPLPYSGENDPPGW